MKKKVILVSIIVLVVIITVVGLYIYSKDNIRFKFSYESLNSVEYDNGKKIKISIPFDNRIKYLSNKELDEFLENGTGILYLGYNSCPWCRNIVPILIDVVKENDIKTINYVDIHKNNLNKTNIYEKLNDYLRENDEGKKVVAVPDVYVIKDGKVLNHHIGTVSSYRNPYLGMNEEQKNELKEIYENMIKELK